MRNLYARLSTVLSERCPAYGLGLLVSDSSMARHTHRQMDLRLRLLLGGKRTQFWMESDRRI